MNSSQSRAGRLEERIIEFAALVCRMTRGMPVDPGSRNIGAQLARAASSPVGNYAEAREAASTRDYINKVKICVKELREARNWIRVAQKAGIRGDWIAMDQECNELLAMLVTCVKKARTTPKIG